MAAKPPRTPAEHGLTIMFEHCTSTPYYPHSARSSPAQSPSPSDPPSNGPLDPAIDSEDCWNLIPYDVPWGPEYYHYKTGSLPGPDGASIFLRSPTPLKNRRTQKAGDHPTCTRCLARGYICEYAEDEKCATHDAERSREPRHRDPSEDSFDGSKDSSPEAEYPLPTSAQLVAPRPLKVEEPDLPPPDLLYYDSASASGSSSPSTAYGSPWNDAFYPAEPPYGFVDSPSAEPYDHCGGVADFYEPPPHPYTMDPEMHAYQPHQPSPTYFHPPALPGPLSPTPGPAVHAPRPLRCTGSPSFLAPEARPPRAAFSSSSLPAVVAGCSDLDAQPFAHAHADDMLIDLCAPAQPAPQIAIPQLPPMPSANPSAVHVHRGGGALDSYPQACDPHAALYYSAHTPAPVPMPQYPFLQYQYSVSTTYIPGLQDGGLNLNEQPMLYTMVASGMTS
ncbi:hypothetical protein C8Q79DRAFT_1000965 [Trametes meyenii]|nr:hypothetical protein C8Q79DRAFT_1000965 [Trametes meyenii]